MVATTRTCQLASAMLAFAPVPISVGLSARPVSAVRPRPLAAGKSLPKAYRQVVQVHAVDARVLLDAVEVLTQKVSSRNGDARERLPESGSAGWRSSRPGGG